MDGKPVRRLFGCAVKILERYAKDRTWLSQMRELGDLGVKLGCERFSIPFRRASLTEANGHNGPLASN